MHQFDKDILLGPSEPFSFSGYITENWSINGVPNVRTRFITCGLLEEDGEIWDQADQLIAISRQIAQYRPHAK